MSTIALAPASVTETLDRLRAHLLCKHPRVACFTTMELTGGLVYDMTVGRWHDQALTVEHRGERYPALLLNQVVYINKEGELYQMSAEQPEFRKVDNVIANAVQRLMNVSLLLFP